MPVFCNAGSDLYLYTVNFAPTAGSAATSVSYLSEGLLTSGMDLLPGQVTVISSPGAGATQYPGFGSGAVTPDSFAFAFDEAGSLQWTLQGATDTITGVGTYDFTSTQVTSGVNVYNPAGDVVVQQLSSPPVIFRYTESWNATPVSAPTSYIYDSPVFLTSLLLDPNAVQLISPPGPNAQPYTQVSLFVAGNNAGEGYFVDGAGHAWLMTAAVSPAFDYPGDYTFTSADVQYYLNDVLQTDVTNATGSVSVSLITPEPGAFAMAVLAGLFLSGLTGIRKPVFGSYQR
jgi:hypothetical protein